MTIHLSKTYLQTPGTQACDTKTKTSHLIIIMLSAPTKRVREGEPVLVFVSQAWVPGVCRYVLDKWIVIYFGTAGVSKYRSDRCRASRNAMNIILPLDSLHYKRDISRMPRTCSKQARKKFLKSKAKAAHRAHIANMEQSERRRIKEDSSVIRGRQREEQLRKEEEKKKQNEEEEKNFMRNHWQTYLNIVETEKSKNVNNKNNNNNNNNLIASGTWEAYKKKNEEEKKMMPKDIRKAKKKKKKFEEETEDEKEDARC